MYQSEDRACYGVHVTSWLIPIPDRALHELLRCRPGAIFRSELQFCATVTGGRAARQQRDSRFGARNGFRRTRKKRRACLFRGRREKCSRHLFRLPYVGVIGLLNALCLVLLGHVSTHISRIFALRRGPYAGRGRPPAVVHNTPHQMPWYHLFRLLGSGRVNVPKGQWQEQPAPLLLQREV